jgi:sterol desaturase/sphingolipid hydroxylase (fatty acid hydroxylase superfamily)
MIKRNLPRIRLTLSVGALVFLVTYMKRDDYTFDPWLTFFLGCVVVDVLYDFVRVIEHEFRKFS